MEHKQNEHLLAGFWLEQWFIDPLHGCFETNGHRLHIEPKVMEVLVCLASEPGQVVSRKQLLDQVWGNLVVSEEVLTRCISELRTALNDTSRERKFIRTVPKRGYSLIISPVLPSQNQATVADAPQVQEPEPAPEPLSSTPPSSSTEDSTAAELLQTSDSPVKPAPKPWHRLISATSHNPQGREAIAIVLVVAMVLLVKWFKDNDAPEATPAAPAIVAAAQPAAARSEASDPDLAPLDVVVLPFVNLSAASDNDYISTGLTEDIRNKLIRTQGIRVAARTSSEIFVDQLMDIRQIGQTLNTTTVLEGTVRVDQSRIRVTVQLSDSQTGHPIWADTYERNLGDVFVLQDQVATDVVNQLAPALVQTEVVASAEPLPKSVQAYDNYLLGRFHWNKRTLESIQQAQLYFQKAIDLDPEFSPAYAGLADSLMLAHDYSGENYDSAIEQASPLISHALALNPNDAEANASRGLLAVMQGDADTAKTYYKRAVELNPNYSMARMWYGSALVAQGQLKEGHAQYKAALNLDPLHPSIQYNYLSALQQMGRYEEVQELAPYFYSTSKNIGVLKAQAMAYADTGRYDTLLQFLKELSPNEDLSSQHLLKTALEALIQLQRFDEVSDYLQETAGQYDTKFELGFAAKLAVARRDPDALEQVYARLSELGDEVHFDDCDYAFIAFYRGLFGYMQRDWQVAQEAFAEADTLYQQQCQHDYEHASMTIAYQANIARKREQLDHHKALLERGQAMLASYRQQGRNNVYTEIAALGLDVAAAEIPHAQSIVTEARQKDWYLLAKLQYHPLFDDTISELYPPSDNYQLAQYRFQSAQNNSRNVNLKQLGL